jgi:cobalt-zinc-cadmium efflux system outer membrane protein
MANSLFARGALLLIYGFVFIASPTSVWAVEQPLSLAEVIEYCLHNNADLKSLREENGVFDAGKVKAGVLPNPTLDFEASTGALTGSRAENTLSVGISQELLLAGKKSKRLAVAERELEIYRYHLADRERLMREDVAFVFYDVTMAEKRLALADRSIALNRQLLDVTIARLAVGDIPELEMNMVKVELARSEAIRIELENALNQYKEKLSALMGMVAGTQYEISGAIESNRDLGNSLAELKQMAMSLRPDLKALEAERRRGNAGVLLARAEGVPNLTAGIAVWRDTKSMNIGGLEGTDKSYTIGMKLSVPIPVFDRNQAGVQEALAKRVSTESRLAAASRNLEREVETAYASYKSSEKILSLYKASIIPQLEENLNLTGEAYRLGEVGILSVMQEQKKFFEVSEDYLKAQHEHQIAHVKLESVVAKEITGGMQ